VSDIFDAEDLTTFLDQFEEQFEEAVAAIRLESEFDQFGERLWKDHLIDPELVMGLRPEAQDWSESALRTRTREFFEDHAVPAQARNKLADALEALLRADRALGRSETRKDELVQSSKELVVMPEIKLESRGPVHFTTYSEAEEIYSNKKYMWPVKLNGREVEMNLFTNGILLIKDDQGRHIESIPRNLCSNTRLTFMETMSPSCQSILMSSLG